MDLSTFEQEIRSIAGKVIEERVHNSDAIAFQVYDIVLDRIEKYLKRIIVIVCFFFGLLLAVIGYFGYRSVNDVERSIEDTLNSKASSLLTTLDKKVGESLASVSKNRDDLENLKHQLDTQSKELSDKSTTLQRNWDALEQKQEGLSQQFTLYFSQVKMATNDIPEEQKSKFKTDITSFWDYGIKIGLFDKPLSRVDIQRGFNISLGADSHSGLVFFADDKGILSVASVAVTSEENFLGSVITDRLAEINESVQAHRKKTLGELSDESAQQAAIKVLAAMNSLSRGVSEFLVQRFLVQHLHRPPSISRSTSLDATVDTDEVARQWTTVFRSLADRASAAHVADDMSVDRDIVAMWRRLTADDAQFANPVDVAQWIIAADPEGKLDQIRDAAQNYFQAMKPTDLSTILAPSGGKP
jgi:hypothetical protein